MWLPGLQKKDAMKVMVWVLDSGRKDGLADSALPDRAAELPQLPQLESDLGRVRETINLLLTPEREARQKRLNELEKNEKKVLAKVTILTERKNRFELTTRPEREGLERATEEAGTARLAVESNRVELGRHFGGVLDMELSQRRDQFRANFPKWTECFEEVQRQAEAAGKKAIEARGLRKSEREKLAIARDEQGHLLHPEYQGEFSADDESNEAWAARLRDLETVELEKSTQLATDRKREWERRLEDNVLNELNRRITDAQNTIRLLDRYLSQPVGKSRYRITQRKDTVGYGAVWTLLSSGLEPTDPLTAAIHDDDVQRAKEELMRAVNATDQGDDRARRLLDYRNYHHYDLEEVPADKPDAPPISFSSSGDKNSGGEGQAPFFILMLAAFRRVYDRGDRSSTRSQQLGLVPP